MKRVGVAFILAFFLVACGDKTQDLADINGKKVSKQTFQTFLKFKRISISDENKKKRLLDDYLNREALSLSIEKSEAMDPSLIEVEIDEFRKEMLISRYFEKYLRDTVTDQAVKNYYDTHVTEYEVRKAKVAHILLRTNPKMGEIERKAKLTTAGEAFSKARTGEDFAELAKAYSEDKMSARKGGEIGWLKEGSISPSFSARVFSMEQGEISEPLETPFGFHVIKLIEAPRTVRKPFDEVKGNIRYQLRNEAKKAEMERLLATVTIKKY
ncbi:peptidylprolyl isomerase [Desulfoluna butyratoxydans]|uniref:Trigger factor/sura domain n=1 Tax=Desulfoluna butyratoxydans TaxID=231438 RepID=A0A4U8YMU2_9BACT|nr:peptidylprolyl isomerase [Desulfoluna butyratoxydans]VFQ45090.1 trigger factor/sura domain [Desulfoluna butyratoxydans]